MTRHVTVMHGAIGLNVTANVNKQDLGNGFLGYLGGKFGEIFPPENDPRK